jgi:flagellar biosynthesis protein FlhF
MIRGELRAIRSTLHEDAGSRSQTKVLTSGDPFIRGLVLGGVEPVLARILSERARARAAPTQGLGVARVPDLAGELIRALSTADPLWSLKGRTLVALVGPTGVGKTRTIAKLAALSTFVHNRSVGVISTDLNRMGASATLAALADVCGVAFASAGDGPSLACAVQDLGPRDLVLIDTPGLSPWDDAGLLELDALLDSTPIERHLVLSASTPSDRARTLARRFGGDRLRSIVVTKVDESDGPGAILSSVWGTGLGLSHVCDGQEIPNSCHGIDPQRWSQRVVGSASRGR